MQLASLLLQILLVLGLAFCIWEQHQEGVRTAQVQHVVDGLDDDLTYLATGLVDLTTIVRARIPAPSPVDVKMQATAEKPPTTGPSGHSFHGHPTVHHDR